MPRTSLAIGRIVVPESRIGIPSCAGHMGMPDGVCDRADAWLLSGAASSDGFENATPAVVVERRPGRDFRQCPPTASAQAGARIDRTEPDAGRRDRVAHDGLAGSIRPASVVLNRPV